MPPLRLIRLHRRPIFEQLQIEEALLRADEGNWCLINMGAPPAIVMGISGKAEELLNPSLMEQKPVPLIRRFSGGGTVFIDEMTCFITLICQKDSVSVPCCPRKILQWSETLYQPVFAGLNFRLIENDYVFGEKKFGGNAQYLCKNRWLHHSSLLWDFRKSHMEYLRYPKRVPNYRKGRAHADFLCRLKDYLPCRETFVEEIINVLRQRFHVIPSSRKEVKAIQALPYRKATTLLYTHPS